MTKQKKGFSVWKKAVRNSNALLSMAGYREKEILNSCISARRIMKTAEHDVIKLTAENGHSCLWDERTRTFCG